MRPENLYHTGIVVDDLDATLDWFTKVAGYRWTDVVEVDQVAQTPRGAVTIPMRMAYSGADPRVEIIQAVPGTVWVPADSGVHHLGYWSDDVESDLATLEASGMPYEVKSFNPDGSGKLLWAYCKGQAGPRIELVSRAMKPFIEYWFATAAASHDAEIADHGGARDDN
jgi:catechol 2,3-dioxygenase-like lactoylglutathione lyase family enzyme